MAIAWKRYLTEASNEYPLLDLLEADFPALVRAVRRRGAEAKNFADQERRKREANPQFKASRAYRRAARQAAKKKAAAKEKFDTLMGAAGLGPWAVGRPPTDRSERPPMWGDGPAALRAEFRKQLWERPAGGPPPHHSLLLALWGCSDPLPEADCRLAGLVPPATYADAAHELLGEPAHVICDLHGYWVDEAVELAGRRLREAQASGCGYVTLIHGSPEVADAGDIRSLGKGGIKWSVRDCLADGRWNEFVLPEGSPGHVIRDGRMTLAIRHRTAVQTM